MNNPGMINAANGRVLRTTSRGGRTFSALAYNSTKTSYTDGVINVTTISPPMSLNAGLPAVSMVPYLENPRYVTNFNTPLIPGINSGVATQTITLPSIPDGILIYAKPTVYADSTNADWYIPITNINIQFDNVQGYLSSMTQEQLYNITQQNSLCMSYDQYQGRGKLASTGANVQLTGSPLYLKFNKDIPCSEGVAPGINGNFTFNANLSLNNLTAANIASYNIFVVCINSGFFASSKGESRVIKSCLTEEDVIHAPLSNAVSRSEMARVVGGFSFRNFLSSAVSKLPSIETIGRHIGKLPEYHAKAKELSSHVKPYLPESVQQGLSAVGLGRSGGGRSGGGRSGGSHKGLSARLM